MCTMCEIYHSCIVFLIIRQWSITTTGGSSDNYCVWSIPQIAFIGINYEYGGYDRACKCPGACEANLKSIGKWTLI